MNTRAIRYKLEQYKGKESRYSCPGCQHKEKTFARYVDVFTGQYLHPSVGRCNREDKCGYHKTPKQYFEETTPQNHRPITKGPIASIMMQPRASELAIDALKYSLRGFDENSFTMYLSGLIGPAHTKSLVEKYFIGTSDHWPGATVFWQIDLKGRIRAGKIMLYDSESGHRIKKPYNHITWIHKVLKIEDFDLNQCLFGEHLLQDKSRPVAIVESEKTAIIASAYLPAFIWLACGGLSNLTPARIEVLKGRRVVLFPDVNGFGKWQVIAQQLSTVCTIQVSDLLERQASELDRMHGSDLADFLVRYKPDELAIQKDIGGQILKYWRSYPEARKYFIDNPEDQIFFHNEFVREFQACSIDDFLKCTFSIS